MLFYIRLKIHTMLYFENVQQRSYVIISNQDCKTKPDNRREMWTPNIARTKLPVFRRDTPLKQLNINKANRIDILTILLYFCEQELLIWSISK